ncbi:hypothetical protein Q4R37_12955, partial [Morganella morganii]
MVWLFFFGSDLSGRLFQCLRPLFYALLMFCAEFLCQYGAKNEVKTRGFLIFSCQKSRDILLKNKNYFLFYPGRENKRVLFPENEMDFM